MSMQSPTVVQPHLVEGTYDVDVRQSELAFTTRHLFGLGGVHGTFALESGEVVIASHEQSSSARATASANSFSTGNAKRDEHVRSSDFLDVRNHPTIEFISDEIVQRDDTNILAGTLTVRSVHVPLSFTIVDIDTTGDTLTLRATANVDRYAFGITKKKGMAARHLNLDLHVNAIRRP